MWENLTSLSVTPWNLIIRATVIYFVILILLRLGGKRELGQMSPTEFVVILLISNAVQNAMNAGDNSLVAGVILSVVLVTLSWLISMLSYHFQGVRDFIEGKPVLLIHKGEILGANLKKERLTHSELKSLLRKQGFHSLNEIQTAILEADGTLSVIRVGN